MAQGEAPRLADEEPNGESGRAHAEPSPVTAPGGATTPTARQDAPQQPLPQPLPQPYRPQQQPYVQYPYATGFQYMQPPVRVLPAYSKPWTLCKLVLTGLSLCWDTAVFCLAIVFLTHDLSGLAGYDLVISIVGMAWNAAELITFFLRSHKSANAGGDHGHRIRRGIHPGAHVGVHLVLWLASLFAVFMALLLLSSVTRWLTRCGGDVDEDDTSYNSCGYYYDDFDLQGSYLHAIQAFVAMWCLALITHFVLFVLACIDTHQRNRLKSRGVVYSPPPVGGPVPGMVPLSYYPPPALPQQMYMSPVPVAPAPQGKAPLAPQQDYRNLAGFYAPQPSPAPQAPVRASPPQPATESVASGSGGHEITAAPPRA